MAIRTTQLGGTDWADGDILTAADLNDTIEAIAILTTKGDILVF